MYQCVAIRWIIIEFFGMMQGCALVPTLFGIFFCLLHSDAFGSSSEGVCLHSRTDGKLFNLVRQHAKTKVQQVLIRDMVFANDIALISRTEEDLKRFIDQLAQACTEAGLIKRPMSWAKKSAKLQPLRTPRFEYTRRVS